MSSQQKLQQESPGFSHDTNETHENILHQTHDPVSIQNLTHYPKAAAQVADTKTILIDRTQIELTEKKLCHIMNYHIHSENIKECYKIPKIWRTALTREEKRKLFIQSIKLARVSATRILAKLRGEKLKPKEKNWLIMSCIQNGWYFQFPYKNKLRAEVLKLRLIPVLTPGEKIAVYEMCKKNNWQRQAKIFAVTNPITFLFYFANNALNKLKNFVPTEEQITEYSKL